MFTICSLYIHYMFTIYIHYIFIIYSLYIHYIFTIYSLYVQYIFTICSLYIHYIFAIFSLYIHYILTIGGLHMTSSKSCLCKLWSICTKFWYGLQDCTVCLCTKFEVIWTHENRVMDERRWTIILLCYMGKLAGRHSLANQHGCRNINVWRVYNLWTALTLAFYGISASNLQRSFKTE